jgi:hypothetical protein
MAKIVFGLGLGWGGGPGSFPMLGSVRFDIFFYFFGERRFGHG